MTKDVDWAGLIEEVVRRTEHIPSATSAAKLIPVDRQTLERWRAGGRATPRGENKKALLAWARCTLTPEELARYRVPPVEPPVQDSRKNERPNPGIRRR